MAALGILSTEGMDDGEIIRFPVERTQPRRLLTLAELQAEYPVHFSTLVAVHVLRACSTAAGGKTGCGSTLTRCSPISRRGGAMARPSGGRS